MSSSDSMFLFEFTVENFKCRLDNENVFLKASFENIFEICLDKGHEFKTKVMKAKAKPKKKIINPNESTQKKFVTRIKTSRSLLINMKPHELLELMSNKELEISLWNETVNEKLGLAKIPWEQTYINYIIRLKNGEHSLPANERTMCTILCNNTNKKIATVILEVSLTYFEDKTIGKIAPNTHVAHITLKTSKDHSDINSVENGDYELIKTTYMENRNFEKTKSSKHFRSISKPDLNVDSTKTIPGDKEKTVEGNESSIVQEILEDAIFERTENKVLSKSKSLSLIEQRYYKPVNYIFGDNRGPFGNRVYCINYCTVERNPSSQSSKSSNNDKSLSDKSSPSKANLKFRPCDSECKVMKNRSGSCPASTCTLDIPEEAAPLISIAKCKQIFCDNKQHRVLPPPSDDRILVDLSSMERDCCHRREITEMVEEVVGGVTAEMKVGKDPCFCSCECRFGFMKKTTYCKVCGGYEMVGEELPAKQIKENFPCPYYHKLIDKNKLKALSTSGSDSKKRGDDISVKAMKVSSSQKAVTSEKRTPAQIAATDKKSVESEKDKKSKRKIKDDRFKFNYGYKGIPPQIGHSRCAFPCTGTLNNVPKKMGWLWTAEDVAGIKFRPGWKPGATNKHVVRLLRIARNPGQLLLPKKKRREALKKRLIRPLLTVHKKEGEFTVTMETMKTYAKPRAINQSPYEDKPVLIYTIGRTEEENRERKKRKEREQRRLERAQRQFIQSAFRDMCREICMKTYQQALSVLPDMEAPDCSCYPALPSADRTDLDLSCPCSEDESSIGSDTDSDEWIVEFTPPCATFDPTMKVKKVVKTDNSTQYTYLDYKVKLFDRYGNPVPRYFKGPDGKQQCSDLGGFWGPDKKWLTINSDGYVAPDERWAPNYFIGPNGETVEATTGKFQAANNKWLVVGIDGYVDCQGRWKFYPRPRGVPLEKKRKETKTDAGAGDKKNKEDVAANKSEASWSCFGGASPKELSKLGIVGHGHDKKLLLSALKELLARGENVKIPQPSTVFRLPVSKRRMPTAKQSGGYYEERTKCKHSLPSDKGIVAVDDQGNKTYFHLQEFKNIRPKERLKDLASHGISLSSFHVPCFHSFIGSELMKKQQRDRLIALSAKSIGTQKFQ